MSGRAGYQISEQGGVIIQLHVLTAGYGGGASGRAVLTDLTPHTVRQHWKIFDKTDNQSRKLGKYSIRQVKDFWSCLVRGTPNPTK